MYTSGHSHSFDTGIAQAFGVKAAIVLNHIIYWLKINYSKEQNLIDGKVWMFETQEQMAKFLDYLTIDEIKKSITKLINAGVLIKGNFNDNAFVRTSWYTVKDQSIIQNNFTKERYGSMGRAPGLDQKSASARYLKEDNNKNNKEQQHKEPVVVHKQPTSKTIWDCLRDVLISEKEKKWITKNYSEETVIKAIAFATHPDNLPKTTLIAWIKYACREGLSEEDVNKKEETIYEKLKKRFKNGHFYNNAECYLNENYIGFLRGMKDGRVKFDRYCTLIKVIGLLDDFEIPHNL